MQLLHTKLARASTIAMVAIALVASANNLAPLVSGSIVQLGTITSSMGLAFSLVVRCTLRPPQVARGVQARGALQGRRGTAGRCRGQGVRGRGHGQGSRGSVRGRGGQGQGHRGAM